MAATFYIEAVESGSIALSKVGSPTAGDCYFGVNDNTCPDAYTYGNSISLTAGQKCYFIITSTSTDFSAGSYLQFSSTNKINVGGNLSDLIGQVDLIPRNYCFVYLFKDCTNLIDASNLVVCNNFNSKESCYSRMFSGCTGLTTPPELPATTLATFCYTSMFDSCTSLTTAPELPATTLAYGCYFIMFTGCTSLTTPPALPATTLADSCYLAMFNGCTNIKLSETQTGNYQIPYRIPTSGTGTAGTNSLNNMFASTGGTFTGTPTINTTYYLYAYPKNVKLKDGYYTLYPQTKVELVDNAQAKPTTNSNISVSVTPTALSAYNSWDTAQAYGYYADITVSGLTTNSLINNIVMTDTILDAIAPVIDTGANKITVYTKDATALSGTIYTLVTSEV